MTRPIASALALALTPLVTAVTVGCGGEASPSADGTDSSPDSSEANPETATETSADLPEFDPANFVDTIDNPYLLLTPGRVLTYEGTSGDTTETVVVEVTDETRDVLGVATTVVRDTVTQDGELVEDTYDWFAQDRDGNVWYFGEDSNDYEDGEVVSTEGSWEAGEDGAEAGIVMLAEPSVGDVYRQEYYPGEAEDMGEVLNLAGEAAVPYGDFEQLLVTKDYTPLEPDVVENKYYAEGVGLVLETKPGREDRLELVDITEG